MKIAVVTVSLPEREAFRAECIASIRQQTLPPIAHFVSLDYQRVGPAAMLNATLPACVEIGADWVAQLADDDLADPHHLATLAAAADDADIVYSYCKIGRAHV